MNLREIETLRTKEELLNYYKEMGKNITEEEIENLKKSYKQKEENCKILNVKQLNKVVGGVKFKLCTTDPNRLECFHFHYVDPSIPGKLVIDFAPGETLTLDRLQLQEILKPLKKIKGQASIDQITKLPCFDKTDQGESIVKEDKDILAQTIRQKLYGRQTIPEGYNITDIGNMGELILTKLQGRKLLRMELKAKFDFSSHESI